jgi:hypothetical protein
LARRFAISHVVASTSPCWKRPQRNAAIALFHRCAVQETDHRLTRVHGDTRGVTVALEMALMLEEALRVPERHLLSRLTPVDRNNRFSCAPAILFGGKDASS